MIVTNLSDMNYGRGINAITERVLARFFRQKKRDRVHSYPAGFLGPVHRKNAWQIGGQIGEPDPYGRQYLMGSSEWDSDALQD